MKKLVRTIGGIVVAASFASPALAVVPGRVLATAVVDGFTVNVLRFPTVARLNVPKSTTGTVTTGVNAQGTNPYGGTLLSGSPFLSINGGRHTQSSILRRGSHLFGARRTATIRLAYTTRVAT